MKIIAFAGSTSKQSINKKLVTWVSTFFYEHDIEILDLNNYDVTVFSVDKQDENGFPPEIIRFSKKLAEADLILLSLAEHNGAYTAAFKNTLDWVSRIPDTTVFHDKPIFLMATSPGKRGGSSVLEIASNRFQFNGGKIIETFSLPSFNDNFEEGKGITHDEILYSLSQKIKSVKSKVAN